LSASSRQVKKGLSQTIEGSEIALQDPHSGPVQNLSHTPFINPHV